MLVTMQGSCISDGGSRSIDLDVTQEQKAADVVRQKSIEILRDALDSDEFWISMHAAEALTLAGQQDRVRASLEPRLLSETDDRKRCGLARELIRAGDNSAMSVLESVLRKKDTYAHVHAMESLYKVGQISPGDAYQQATQQDLNHGLRIWASATLARRGDESALAIISAYLDHQDPMARSLAGYVLGQLGDRSEIDKIRRNHLNAQEPIQRFFNVAALVYLDDSALHAELQDYLLHADAGIRALAANLLAETRLDSYDAVLHSNLEDSDPDVRVRSADAILRF